ncbi:TIGR02680 family protein [Nocardia beijingensis]|uniref:TIGR02680 family protein n=1 Tax=Nocardia beijingensis TaxID=95162 RepID=UPI001893ECB2|nr:TIGR02680 family protein [Nocardia beijingensis]MBF6077447.1 TIGR02680 family protein [Nocardia beijingensis]
MTVDPVKYHPNRWRLARAGVVNVWHYLDTEFTISGGRLILRGANGSGKSRALEMLLPFLLDADRRRMDATGSQKVSLDELMKTGARGQTNRVGYLWLELQRTPEPHDTSEFLTLGAHIKYSASAHRSEVSFFTTSKRVGEQLPLLGDDREVLSRDRLHALISAENLTDAEGHRENVRSKVFGLRGDSDRDRFTGLIQLLHTLRSPDVGNRIDEGKLPQILSDALPPLSEQTLQTAGERLDGLTETRLAQQRLVVTLDQVRRFHAIYGSYAAGVLTESATALQLAAKELGTAQDTRNDLTEQGERLRAQVSSAEATIVELIDEETELRTSIESLDEAPQFQQRADLVPRETALAALKQTAEHALQSAHRARSDEAGAAERFAAYRTDLRAARDAAATALTRTAARLADIGTPHGRLPASITLREVDEPPVTDSVRDTLDQAPAQVRRPHLVTVEIVPDDVAGIGSAALDCARAASNTASQVARREEEARRLASRHMKLLQLENTAEEAEHQARTAEADAGEAAQRRDDLAVSLNQSWREWISSADTTRLMPDAQWSCLPIEALRSDTEALAGDPADDTLLDDLDALAAELARPIDGGLAARIADIDRDLVRLRQDAETLRAEKADLEAEHDPEPPATPWHRAGQGTPLWRTIEFRDEVAADDRAGIEGALLAGGLLNATLTDDGALRAANGETYLRPGHARPASPLSQVLRPDPALPQLADLVSDVLAAIGWRDPDATISVAEDGSWRTGMLTGRHHPPTARHIGATTRAATRRARIAEIEQELEQLSASVTDLSAQREQLDEHRRQLVAHIRTAPRSRPLAVAREAARGAEKQAARAADHARGAREKAAHERSEWSRQDREHRAICDQFALPSGYDDLVERRKTCLDAADACQALDSACKAVILARAAADRAREDFIDARTRRQEDETQAESSRRDWAREASSLNAVREALDLPIKELMWEIEKSTEELKRTRNKLDAARRERGQAELDAVGVETKLAAAEAAVRQRTEELRLTAELFNARLHLPGLRDAAGVGEIAAVREVTDRFEAAHVAETVLAGLRGRKAAGVGQMLNALAKFGAESSGYLEVSQSFEHGAHLIHIDGVEHHHDLPSVLAHLQDKVESGRQALTDREREVFTEFILGSVTDELRRRVHQARHLVGAMNAGLADTTTSHGIGVRIGWELDGSDPELRRLVHLVGIADQVRSDQDNEELVALVRARVERLYSSDNAAGYTAHLREALDYRAWHTVEVTILGPEPNQTRRISRRAKISQGETRFVSYVTLFAAADSYLSGLPDAEGALRLVLLDDAFAKVDERAIGELMGLLVRLDIDFVMTGHALWGTVSEVPALDIYEIRRIGDSSVVPTRIHWDGRKRTYLASVGGK